MKLILPITLLHLSVTVGCCSLTGLHTNETAFQSAPLKPNDQARAYAHYLTALYEERRGNADEALEEMSQAAMLDPEAPAPTLRLIRAYLQRQDYQNALKFTEHMSRLTPDNAKLWILLGEIYHQLHQDNDAAGAFSKAIELDPENVQNYGALAKLLEDMNDLVATVEIYERLVTLDPDSVLFHFELGVNLARMNDLPAARAALERAVEVKPDFVRARLVLALVCLDENRLDEAVAHLRRYLIRRPGDPDALEQLAYGLTRLGKYEEAIEILRGIVEGAGAEAEHHLALMYVLLRSGQPREAERYMPAEDAPFLTSFLRAVARRDRGEPVIPLLETLDQIEGSLDGDCDLYLAELLRHLGREECAAYFLQVLDDFSATGVRSRTLLALRARILMVLERYAEAQDILSGVLNEFGADKDLHYSLAVTCEELDDFDGTERHLKAYLESAPNDAEVLNFLGYLYAEHGVKINEAETLVRRALEQEPESPYYLDSLGWVFYRQGKAQEAVEHIQRAIAFMEGDDAILRDHLGDAYLLNGDVDRAVTEWRKARRLDPELAGVQEKLDQYGGQTPPGN